MDFNHIALSIHGVASDYPYPAGFYKKSGKNSKDVLVSFSDRPMPREEGRLEISYAFPKSVSSGFPANGTVVVENVTGVAMPSATITIQSTPYDVAITKSLTNIPPFAKVSVPVSIPLPSYFLKGEGMINVSVGGQTSRYDFEIEPLVYKFIIPISIIAVVLILLGIISMRGHFLWKHPKK
jgi:hypothetical protein